MAIKPIRVSVGPTTVQAWAPLTSLHTITLRGGLLALERGTAVLPNNAVATLLDGTAAAAGTLAYIPLGGSATFAGAGPAAVPFDFGDDAVYVSGAGGLGIRLDPATVGLGTITGYFRGRERRRQ